MRRERLYEANFCTCLDLPFLRPFGYHGLPALLRWPPVAVVPTRSIGEIAMWVSSESISSSSCPDCPYLGIILNDLSSRSFTFAGGSTRDGSGVCSFPACRWLFSFAITLLVLLGDPPLRPNECPSVPLYAYGLSRLVFRVSNLMRCGGRRHIFTVATEPFFGQRVYP